MASFPLEVLYGLYLGVLLSIVPALVSWTLAFAFKHLTGVTIPGLGVVVLAAALAGANGGLMALADPSLTASENQVRLTVALLVVLMVALYAHSRGDAFGASMPKKFSLRKLTERTLSTDVIELVGGRGQVEVTVTGQVLDMESYPPVPADLREEIREGSWTFPADVPLIDLESRVADRLRTEFDLADVSVRLDERARATVTAAPPTGALSKRVPTGRRAVSVSALLPTGLARGDEVTVVAGDRAFEGTVLGAKTFDAEPTGTGGAATDGGATATDGGEPSESPPATPTVDGGPGRLTVAVERSEATDLLQSSVERVVVRSRGVRREFELVSLLRRAGQRFRRVTVAEDADLAGTTLGAASVRDAFHVAVLAVRHEGTWKLAPRGSQPVSAGDDLYVVGGREALAAFAEAVA